MGSKARIAKQILALILRDRQKDQWYVEPFAGGMNSISETSGKRLAADCNSFLIAMWQELCNGWKPPLITKNEYLFIKNNRQKFDPCLVGWAGFNCSYSGKWFGGYAGQVVTKGGSIRDYQAEAVKNVTKQIPKLKDVIFQCSPYWQLQIPAQSVVYCDPPYANTTAYDGSGHFDHEQFWQWARNLASVGHSVWVSEYTAPQDFRCVWESPVKSSLSANGRHGGSKESVERLFTLD